MAKSFYKARGIGKDPICVLCGGAGEGPRAKHHLTRGIFVWLCESHRSDEFQRRRAGRDFVVSLLTVWRAAGDVNKRQHGALEDHLKRVRQPKPQRDLCGSYAWPRLREEAEERFAAGEEPNVVMADLRGRYEGLPINAPTDRTLRRWFTDGRWLSAHHVGKPAAGSRSTTTQHRVDRNAPVTAPRPAEVNAGDELAERAPPERRRGPPREP